MFSVIKNSVNLDALYLVNLIFGKYFCYFDSNRVTILLQLQLYLDANCTKVFITGFEIQVQINRDLTDSELTD